MRDSRSCWLDKGPVFFPAGTFVDPLRKQLFRFGGERLIVIRWRHYQLTVGGVDAVYQFRLFCISGDNETACEGRTFDVQSQIRFATRSVRAVAGEAMLGQYRSNLFVEFDWCGF